MSWKKIKKQAVLGAAQHEATQITHTTITGKRCVSIMLASAEHSWVVLQPVPEQVVNSAQF
jgi:hypothetical protein